MNDVRILEMAEVASSHPASSQAGTDRPLKVRRGRRTAYLQAAPFALVFLAFFVLPLCFTLIVSFWEYNEYEIIPAFTAQNYVDIFDGCLARLPDLCVTFQTYLSTLKFCLIVWAITLVLGFAIAYFLAFHVRSVPLQTG